MIVTQLVTHHIPFDHEVPKPRCHFGTSFTGFRQFYRRFTLMVSKRRNLQSKGLTLAIKNLNCLNAFAGTSLLGMLH